MFLKFLETTLLKKVCLASDRIVQMFRAGPNLHLHVKMSAVIYFAQHSK